ncbi:MAG: acyl-CoA thioesterase [Mycobacteriaceae bacterium]
MARVEDVLELEQLERDIFRGSVTPSLLQRTFGGQVAGQSLVSAVRTVDERFHVHSLHGYFLRPGNPKEPTVFLVDRIRDGRSFCTRRVTGIQDGSAIFTMSASFHADDSGIEHQDIMPRVSAPEELPDVFATDRASKSELYQEWNAWDIRIIPPELSVVGKVQADTRFASQQRVWMRYRDRLPDSQVFHVCTLAYLSDMMLLGSSRVAHPGVRVQMASLDHALWFLRPFRADEWLLYDQSSPSAGFGRALTQGQIYNQAGDMVAAVVQEGLTRIERDPDGRDEHTGNKK